MAHCVLCIPGGCYLAWTVLCPPWALKDAENSCALFPNFWLLNMRWLHNILFHINLVIKKIYITDQLHMQQDFKVDVGFKTHSLELPMSSIWSRCSEGVLLPYPPPRAGLVVTDDLSVKLQPFFFFLISGRCTEVTARRERIFSQ